MRLLLLPVVLCAALALVASTPAVAQKGDAPRELWDEFPLEPTTTPSAATPEPTRPAPVTVTREDGGIATGVLIALMLTATALGALTAYTASRRRVRSRVLAPAGRSPAGNGVHVPKRAEPAPAAKPPRAERRAAKPARPTRPTRAERRAAKQAATAQPPTSKPVAKPQPAPTKLFGKQAPTPQPAPTEPVAKQAPAAKQPRSKRRAAKQAPTPRPPTSKRAAKPARPPTPKRASKPAPGPPPPTPKPVAKPQPAPTEPVAKQAPTPQPAPTEAVAKPEPAPTEPAPVAKQPRFRRRAAKQAPAPPPPTPKPAVKPTPTPQPFPPKPAAEPRRAPPLAPVPWDSCRIKFHNRRIKAHFFAEAGEAGPVIARSPYFRIGPPESKDELTAPQALRMLVEQLTAAGWRQTGNGSAPWDLRFERAVDAPQPVAPPRSR